MWTQPKFFDAIVGQAEALPQSAAQVAATGDYGDIPLMVLSANSSSPSQMKEHESLARLSSQWPGFESLRLRSLHGFPALWQHIECQRVTVGVLIAFQYGHWR